MASPKRSSTGAADNNTNPQLRPKARDEHNRNEEEPPRIIVVAERLSSTFQPLWPTLGPRERCPICLTTSLIPRATRLTLPCSHNFCSTCIALWLDSSPHCPLCRQTYTLTLYPLLLLPGLTVETHNTLTASKALSSLALTTLPPWILVFLPTILFFADFSPSSPSPSPLQLPWYFWLLFPLAIAWLWALVVATCGKYGGPSRHKHVETRSILEIANSVPYVLYVWDEAVPLTVWMASGTWLMVAGQVVRLIVEVVERCLSEL